MIKDDTFSSKIILLVKSPANGLPKVIPYLNSKKEFYSRKLFEFFGIEKMSKPYPDHDKLLKYFNYKNGVFVEVGANDGFGFDPTYYLEKFRNWSGFLVEPIPSVYWRCQKNRSNKIYNYAAVPFDYPDNKIKLIDCNFMSVVKDGVENYENWVKEGERAQNMNAKEVVVEARPLQFMIDDYFSSSKKIDLLALYVEGYEAEVLKGLDLKKTAPNYIITEIHTEERKKQIEDILVDYILVDRFDKNDYLYKKQHE